MVVKKKTHFTSAYKTQFSISWFLYCALEASVEGPAKEESPKSRSVDHKHKRVTRMKYVIYVAHAAYYRLHAPLSNSLKPVVRPSVCPAKSCLGPKGPSPRQELERSPP